MKHDIVDLVVSVDQGASVLGLRLLVLEKGADHVEVRDLADGLLRFDIDGLSLCLLNCMEGCNLPVVESACLSKRFQTNRGRGHAVKLAQGGHSCVP